MIQSIAFLLIFFAYFTYCVAQNVNLGFLINDTDDKLLIGEISVLAKPDQIAKIIWDINEIKNLYLNTKSDKRMFFRIEKSGNLWSKRFKSKNFMFEVEANDFLNFIRLKILSSYDVILKSFLTIFEVPLLLSSVQYSNSSSSSRIQYIRDEIFLTVTLGDCFSLKEDEMLFLSETSSFSSYSSSSSYYQSQSPILKLADIYNTGENSGLDQGLLKENSERNCFDCDCFKLFK